MVLKSIELVGFKSFAKKTTLLFNAPVTGIVGPNGSGKSNVVEAIRFVLGEQSIKSLRGKGGVDLIFKGSKQLSALSRASVTIAFDNSKRIFSLNQNDGKNISLDFDEVRISREVYSDGQNKYLINDSDVRLKDVIELLASVHVGSSGHHIISQGEADKILNASSKDRRLMIEDALGLKIYQYRIKETERRLDKTLVNMKEVGSLRREIAPHIQFLKKQVEKIDHANELRKELIDLYNFYGSREVLLTSLLKDVYTHSEQALQNKKEKLKMELKDIESHMQKSDVSPFHDESVALDVKMHDARTLRDECMHQLGRLEGMKDALMGQLQIAKNTHVKIKSIPFDVIERSYKDSIDILNQIIETTDVFVIHEYALELRESYTLFLKNEEEDKGVATVKSTAINTETIDKEIDTLNNKIKNIQKTLADLETQKQGLVYKEKEHRTQIHEKEKGYYDLKAVLLNTENEINSLAYSKQKITTIEESFENELKEGVALLGSDMPYKFSTLENVSIDVLEASLEEAKKKIERIKIKLEESGGLGGSDIVKEYTDTLERDQFLGRELDDLNTSIAQLRDLIIDLKAQLDSEFKNGIEKINTQFQKFFALMFGGGSAHLSVVVEHKRSRTGEDEDEIKDEEEMEFERGIEIGVSLPQKKVKELTMLSGGERSLTSIALLFAMSQVNPPPFLVLDETDAALDEANSRRYGDMIENLSQFSQLILVTHNRETMSRAQVLFGVTVGADGGSKILSIKFDEATQFAK